MVVATGSVFSFTDALVKLWKFAAATPKYTLAVQNGVVGVSLTNTTGLAGTTNTKGYGPYTIGYPTEAGVGNDKATAVGEFASAVAIDGTFSFESITGADATTAQGTPVFLTGAGALTLTASGNTRVGVINYPATYDKTATGIGFPVAIGL